MDGNKAFNYLSKMTKDEHKTIGREDASILLEQEFDSIVSRIATVSDFLADNAELNSDGDICTNNPNVKFYVPDGVVGISFIENEDEREYIDKPWMWWMELDSTQEYNAFATLEEAVDDFMNNISRIEEIIAEMN